MHVCVKKGDRVMATKALNFKMDDVEIAEMKQVASVYNITLTDLVKEAVKAYIADLKKDPFYRLTVNVMDASEEESKEVLDAIESLSDDDMKIETMKHYNI